MMVVALIAPLCQPPVCITPLAVVQNVMRDTPGAKGHGVCQAQDDHYSPFGGDVPHARLVRDPYGRKDDIGEKIGKGFPTVPSGCSPHSIGQDSNDPGTMCPSLRFGARMPSNQACGYGRYGVGIDSWQGPSTAQAL